MTDKTTRTICFEHSRYTKGCTGCRAAAAVRNRRRTRQIAYGTWRGAVDAQPVAEHVRTLIASGMSRQAIARSAGLSKSLIDRLASEPPKTVHAATSDAVLAVHAGPTPEMLVSSLGTARRLQALMAVGWDSRTLAARLGVAYQQVSKWRYRYMENVPYRVHRQVAVLYRALECQDGPSDRARQQARVRGYVPPIQWDDDGDIDNPQARPKGRLRPTTSHERQAA